LKKEKSKALSELHKLFCAFDPLIKPVLARILLVQACLSNLIIESYELEGSAELRNSVERFISSDEFGRGFAWKGDITGDDRALVLDYIVERLSWIPERERLNATLT
jgi:hypothetical protein